MKGEVIGGGWLVLLASKKAGRFIGPELDVSLEFADVSDAVKAAQRFAELYPGHAFCVLKQQLEIIIQDSAAPADTAAGGSGFSPDAGAVAGTPQLQLATAAGDNNGGNRNG
jgi:hypothetical protein